MKMFEQILDELIERQPQLSASRSLIWEAFEMISASYNLGGKLLLCGNGGSAADCEHIAGELMKGYIKKRNLDPTLINTLKTLDKERGEILSTSLQGALPAIALTVHTSLITAICNDNDSLLMFAQQVMAMGKKNDVLLGISTSGNSENVIHALITAKAMGLKTIGLTGTTGGAMKEFCDVLITVPGRNTPIIQEFHIQVYHTLCEMIEEAFFD